MKKAAQLRQGVRSQLAQASALHAPGGQIIGLWARPQDDAASKFGCPCSIHQMRGVAEKPYLLQMQEIFKTKKVTFQSFTPTPLLRLRAHGGMRSCREGCFGLLILDTIRSSWMSGTSFDGVTS